jgi:hypothetical protein
MMLSDDLRAIALRSLSYSRDCFDLKGAERFRLLADDLLAKAAELEENAGGVSVSLAAAADHGRPGCRTDRDSNGKD